MRWLFRLLGLIVVLVVVVVGGLLLIPADRIAALVAQRFEAATGRQIVIAGGVHPTLWPELGVRTGKVEIANASWSKAGPMMTAAGLTVGVEPLALLSGAVKVARIELDQPQILLETAKDGRGNWVFGPAAAQAAAGTSQAVSAGGGLPPVSIGRAVIHAGTVTFLDDASGTKQAAEAIDATLKLPDPAGPADVQLSARVNGQPLTLTATLAKAAEVLAGRASPVAFTLTAGNSTLGFDGSADPAGAALQGKLDAKLGDLPALLKAAGLAAPALPQGLGAKSIAAKGTLTADARGSVTLDQAALTLDGNAFTGRLALNLAGGRPKLSAILSAGKLDLSSLSAAGGGAPAKGGGTPTPAAAAPGWSKAPIDASPLRLADADLTLGASAVDLGSLKLGRTDVTLALAGGKATIGLKQVVAYQGTITGQINADATKGLALAGDLKIANVALQPLLTDLAGYKRLVGTGTLAAKLQSSGTSMNALMHALSGSGSLAFGKGELEGFDLAGMVTHLNANYIGDGAKTIFDAVKASFAIQNGVLSNDDLTMASPIVDATGKGTIDIGGRTLAYTVTPVALKGIASDNGIAVPVKFSGSWASPRIGLDMNSALGQKIQDQRQKLKDKAQSEAEKALGLPAGSTGNGSLKDIAKGLKLLPGN